MQVFFVCGAPKSGTTWLQRILDAHPELACSGEGHFAERFAAPVAQVVNDYNRLLQLETEQVYQGRPYYRPVDQAEFDELARAFILSRLSSRAGPGVTWVGDKTPRYTHQLEDLNRLFPQARIFHIVRDPREVAESHLAHSERAGVATAFTPGSPENAELLGHVTEGWTRAVEAVDAFSAEHPGRVCQVRYDRLHADGEEEIARAFAFLGVSSEPELVARIAAETSFEAQSGRKAGAEDPRAFLRKGLTGDWSKLDPQAVATVEAACGELMRRKGFLPA